MQRTVRFNNRAFTFVEVLVALVVLMISMLGVLEAMVCAMQHNLEIYSRDESVRIAEQELSQQRNTDFDSLATHSFSANRTYKQHTRSFSGTTTITKLTADSCSVHVQVKWTVNGKDHYHDVTSMISRGT